MNSSRIGGGALPATAEDVLAAVAPEQPSAGEAATAGPLPLFSLLMALPGMAASSESAAEPAPADTAAVAPQAAVAAPLAAGGLALPVPVPSPELATVTAAESAPRDGAASPLNLPWSRLALAGSSGAALPPMTAALPAGVRLPLAGVAANPGAPALPASTPAAAPATADSADRALPAGDDSVLPREMSSSLTELRALPASLLPALPPRIATAGAATAAVPEWSPLVVDDAAASGKGGALHQLLAQRLAVQSSHGIDRALIRLDPPSFGSLEIALRHEGGHLTVQLTASNADMARQLQGIGDFLRQELGTRQFQSVQLEVRHGGGDSQGGHGGRREQALATPGRALTLEAEDESFAQARRRGGVEA